MSRAGGCFETSLYLELESFVSLGDVNIALAHGLCCYWMNLNAVNDLPAEIQ